MPLRSAVVGAQILACFGIVEWAVRGLRGSPDPSETAAGWLAAVVLYGGLGGALGIAASWLGSAGPRAAAAASGASVVLLAAVTGGWLDPLGAGDGPAAALLFAAVAGLFFLILKPFERLQAAAASPAVFALSLSGALLLGGVFAGGAVWLGTGAVCLAVLAAGRPKRKAAAGISSLLALAALAFFARPPLPPRQAAAVDAPSVLLVTIDTLRADRLGVYGYDRARTPVLDALAAQGRLYRDVFSHSAITGPSHLTILSGATPFSHGLIRNGVRAPSELEILPERFAAAGYRTAAVVSGYPVTDDALGLGSRFDRFDDDLRLFPVIPAKLARRAMLPSWLDSRIDRALGHVAGEPAYRPAELATQAALREVRRGPGPFFLWVHYFDPHAPYRPPARFRSPRMLSYDGPGADGRVYSEPGVLRRVRDDPAAREYFRDLYDAEVAYVDEQLGRLVEGARAAEPDLAVVVTADHGEDFGEHGPVISRDLFDTTLHVPLIVVPPPAHAAAPQVVEGQIGLERIPDVVYEVAGMEAAPAAPQQEIEALARRRDDMSYALRTPDWKLIRRLPDHGEPTDELYDLRADPVELADLAAERPDLAAALFSRLQPRIASRNPDADAEPDLTPRQIEILRGLGYIQ